MYQIILKQPSEAILCCAILWCVENCDEWKNWDTQDMRLNNALIKINSRYNSNTLFFAAVSTDMLKSLKDNSNLCLCSEYIFSFAKKDDALKFKLKWC